MEKNKGVKRKMTKQTKRYKIKTMVRRILAFPFLIILLLPVWLFTGGTIKDKWEGFLDSTDEDTDFGV